MSADAEDCFSYALSCGRRLRASHDLPRAHCFSRLYQPSFGGVVGPSLEKTYHELSHQPSSISPGIVEHDRHVHEVVEWRIIELMPLEPAVLRDRDPCFLGHLLLGQPETLDLRPGPRWLVRRRNATGHEATLPQPGANT